MSMTEVPSSATGLSGLVLVMESDADLRATICSALLMDGHRVESVCDCAEVLKWRESAISTPDDFLLALGAGDPDPAWETLRKALDDDAALSRAAVIVLLTIRNGLVFPERARILQKPFVFDELLAMVASDIASARPPGVRS